MFTSFILIHQDGVPLMINIMDISFVKGNVVYMRSMDNGLEADESFEEINAKLCKELNNGE